MDEKQKNAIVKLIRVNLDAHEGYQTASKKTNDSLLNTFFSKCALDRKGYAENLAKEIDPQNPDQIDTDLKADLHRAWIDIKTSSHKFNAKAILEECERGEGYAIEVYNDILKKKEYPAFLKSAIEFQKNDIISKYDQILKLQDNYRDNDDQKNRETPVP